MGVIARTFQTAWHSAQLTASLDIAHTAAKSHGISSHNAWLVAEIGENDAVLLAATCIEIKGSQIYPGRTAHLLIDMKLCGNTLMPYSIACIVDTSLDGLIAYINSIASCFWYRRLIDNVTQMVSVFRCLNHAGGACLEWILMVDVVARMHTESGHRCWLPGMMDTLLCIADGQRVIIDDDLMLLPVALTWCKHIGAGILQHGDEVGVDNRLRKQVFACCE